MKNQDNEVLKNWSKDPKNWIWGMFYYNKEDRRVFPPKKQEWMGVTVNFANTKSIAAFVIMMLFFSFILYMIIKNEK